jgi:hypothetical protein
MAFRLGEPISEGEKRCRMRTQAEMARLYDYVFGHVSGLARSSTMTGFVTGMWR